MIFSDPAQFAERVLGQTLWSKQQEILTSVSQYRRTAVRACHSSGKTYAAAIAVLWWLTWFTDGIVVTTAPTWTQVERVLWGEIRRLAPKAPYWSLAGLSSTKFELSPNRYAIGLSTNEGVRFQGFHGNVLVILDEAPGVRVDIYEAIEGIRAGGDVRILALGNPTIASGPFYDAFTVNRHTWNLITISAFDTPNLTGISLDQLLDLPEAELNRNPAPNLTSRAWVKEKYEEWGAGHPLWESRVLGNFPQQSENALISLSWLERARDQEEVEPLGTVMGESLMRLQPPKV
jgi:phage terminase large subunit